MLFIISIYCIYCACYGDIVFILYICYYHYYIFNVLISILDFDNGPWGNGSNYGSRGGNIGMRGGMDMKGGNYRGSSDSWGGNSGVHSIHMRGLPFKATEQDIADVISKFIHLLCSLRQFVN